MAFQSRSDYGGLHITPEVADRQMDILLNLKCNSQLPKESNSTCCNDYGKLSWVQCLLLTLFLGLLPLITALEIQRGLPSKKIFSSLTVVALALSFCYSADRTQIFGKLHKQYSTREFTMMALVPVVRSLLIESQVPVQIFHIA